MIKIYFEIFSVCGISIFCPLQLKTKAFFENPSCIVCCTCGLPVLHHVWNTILVMIQFMSFCFVLAIITKNVNFLLFGSTAWILAEIVCNASGLGFNGFDENGKPIWNLMTNVNIYQLEVIFFYMILFWHFRTLWKRKSISSCLKDGNEHENRIWFVEYKNPDMVKTYMFRSLANFENIGCFCAECLMAWCLPWVLFHICLWSILRIFWSWGMLRRYFT